MKICSKCKLSKEFIEFVKSSRSKDGCTSWCKECNNLHARTKYEENKDQILISRKIWYQDHKEEIKDQKKIYTIENKEEIAVYQSNYAKDNASKKCAQTAKRNAIKLEAIPKNLTELHFKQMKSIYDLCNIISKLSGIPHHVDHIKPLLGVDGSRGEHAPWNLRIITAKENLKKGNKIDY